MRNAHVAKSILAGFIALAGCHSTKKPGTEPDMGFVCQYSAATRFPAGSADGSAAPGGGKAAGQSRAGRLVDLSLVHQAADARHPVQVGDYLLANDKIGMYIEAARASDGYSPWGGEILAIAPVGDDGLPLPISEYGETLLSLSGQAIKAEQVTVINDGTDGKAAIVRASGVFTELPFLGAFAGFFGMEYSMPAALDYILEPGAESVKIQLHLVNAGQYPADLAQSELYGFFHSYRGPTFTAENGYGALDNLKPAFLAYDAGTYAFAFRPSGGRTISYFISTTGFDAFKGSGDTVDPCAEAQLDYAEIIPSTSLDALRETIRRIDGTSAWRAVDVTVNDSKGAALPGALVHALDPSGTYLTRATVGADGHATVHVPDGAATLQVTAQGYDLPAPVTLAAGATTSTIAVGVTGTIDITATEVGSNAALPVRIQVLPVTAPTALPDKYGVPGQAFGRIYQVHTETGKATLTVPVGMHRVIVSRGWEYELVDQTVNVTANGTVTLTPQLAHSVDTTDSLCADFHIHSYYSVDADDPVLEKVKASLAEGLDLPISSEHEYVVDFQPVIEQLGMTKWAHAFSSEELTTFAWGHFGIIPKTRTDALPNRGAVDWANKNPAEVFAIVHALPEQPALVINHPYSTSFLGYFTSAMFDNTTATGDPTLYSTDFDAIEVFNDSTYEDNRDKSVASWYSLLLHGKRVFATGSSDSHHLRTGPVGYPRTCMKFATDDPSQVTPDQVRDAVKSGESTIDGGLFMSVSGPGGIAPGGMIPNATGTLSFDVTIQAPSWLDAQTLEVIVDGETTQTITLQPSVTAGPGKKWDQPVDVTVPSTLPPGGFHFVVFHASSPVEMTQVAPGRFPFAVSNPILF